MHFLFAYIDPGVGLLAWQAVVAAVLGAVFYIKKSRDWVVGLAVKAFRRKQTDLVAPQEAKNSLTRGR